MLHDAPYSKISFPSPPASAMRRWRCPPTIISCPPSSSSLLGRVAPLPDLVRIARWRISLSEEAEWAQWRKMGMPIGRRSWHELPSEREESSWASAMDKERCTMVGEHGGQEGRREPVASAVQWRWRLDSGGVEC
jgi:hypothetical protein